jgi:hypothetical protein
MNLPLTGLERHQELTPHAKAKIVFSELPLILTLQEESSWI